MASLPTVRLVKDGRVKVVEMDSQREQVLLQQGWRLEGGAAKAAPETRPAVEAEPEPEDALQPIPTGPPAPKNPFGRRPGGR